MVSREQPVQERIHGIAAEIAGTLGLELVEVKCHTSGRRWLVRLDVDRPGPEGVGIGDCERMSRELAAALDAADAVEHAYTLEVSSPGIDRPIRTEDDARRNTGRRVVLETREPIEGHTRIRGILLGLEADEWRLRDESGAEVRVSASVVLSARQDVVF